MDALIGVEVLGEIKRNNNYLHMYYGKVVNVDGNPFFLTLYISFMKEGSSQPICKNHIVYIRECEILQKAGSLSEVEDKLVFPKRKGFIDATTIKPLDYAYLHATEPLDYYYIRDDKYSRGF